MQRSVAGRTFEQKPRASAWSENPPVRSRQSVVPLRSVVVIAGSRPASKSGNFFCKRSHSDFAALSETNAPS